MRYTMLKLHYINDNYISECCGASPSGELDMSTVKYGGPLGFCGRCRDNSIFVLDETDDPCDTKEKYEEQ